MILLVMAVEALLGRGEVDFTSDPWAWDWSAGARSATQDSRGREILCFGDSLIKLAVMPKVIERRTGHRAYNLAMGGGLPASTYYQLRHALEAGARPKAILVDFWPDLLRKDPIHNPRQLSQVATLRDCLELGWRTGDGQLFGKVLTGRLLTSMRCRFEIRESIRAAFRGESYSNRGEVIAFGRNWEANNGSMAWPRHPHFVHEIRGEVERMHPAYHEGWLDGLYPAQWREAWPSNQAYMIKFLELAQAKQIPVFYLLTPLHPVVQKRREQIGFDEAHTRFVREVVARFANVTVVDARRAGYAPWVFMDFIHLDCLGSYEYTSDLADLLKPALEGRPDHRRWLEMPPYHGRPPDIELEDLERSRMVTRQSKESVMR